MSGEFGLQNEFVINQAMKLALDQDTPDLAIIKFLSEAGSHMDCERLFIFEDDEVTQTTTRTYEWTNDGVSEWPVELRCLSKQDMHWWYDHLVKDNVICIHNTEHMKEKDELIYELLTTQGIRNIIVSPLIVKNQIVGFYGISNICADDLFIFYTLLDTLGSFLLSLLKFRNTFRRVEELSKRDRMTNLYNRGYGERKIRDLVESGTEGMFLMMDGNHFKSINDTYGHAVGDKVIMEMAEGLRQVFDEIGIVMRLGGDEFAVFVPTFTNEVGARQLVKQLFAYFDSIDIPQMNGQKISASVGIAFNLNSDKISFEDLYKHADLATYESKKRRHDNQLSFYSPEMSVQ